MDLVVPDTAGQTTMDTVQHYIGQLPDSDGPDENIAGGTGRGRRR